MRGQIPFQKVYITWENKEDYEKLKSSLQLYAEHPMLLIYRKCDF